MGRSIPPVRHDDPGHPVHDSGRNSDIYRSQRPPEADESLENYANYCADLARHTNDLPPSVLVSRGKEVDLHRLFADV